MKERKKINKQEQLQKIITEKFGGAEFSIYDAVKVCESKRLSIKHRYCSAILRQLVFDGILNRNSKGRYFCVKKEM